MLKFWKKSPIGISNGKSPALLLLDLDHNFQGQSFGIFLVLWISRKMVRDRANITIAIREEIRYLPSNSAISDVVHQNFDLHFQVHEVLTVNISIYILHISILQNLGKNLGISQTAIQSCKISMDLQSGVRRTILVYNFFRNLASSSTFSDGVKNTYSQFSRKLFD